MVTVDRHAVSAHDCIPAIVATLWPDIIPIHAISIVVGISPEGGQSLYVLTDSDQPPWVCAGMLTLVKTDVEASWTADSWHMDPEDEDEEEEEEDDDWD
jgi:hypothetical protein